MSLYQGRCQSYEDVVTVNMSAPRYRASARVDAFVLARVKPLNRHWFICTFPGTRAAQTSPVMLK